MSLDQDMTRSSISKPVSQSLGVIGWSILALIVAGECCPNVVPMLAECWLANRWADSINAG